MAVAPRLLNSGAMHHLPASLCVAASLALGACVVEGDYDYDDDVEGLSAIPEQICPDTYDNQPPIDPEIPSESLCRGACGADCPDDPAPDNGKPEGCSESEKEACVNYERGEEPRHKICVYRELSCGTHKGCRDHDACFDACAVAHPPGKARDKCKSDCNDDCVRNHGLFTCLGWATGRGPYDGTLEFSELLSCTDHEGYCEEAGYEAEDIALLE